ncbi:hypothetical protein ACFO0J_07925 [Castellaniella hirudinis]|uniref:Saccharopine dehydrogenase n=1 Tax=Castellaniella hirudinis TaxID=1144617 RepID=A0ABV8RXU9_9BURK
MAPVLILGGYGSLGSGVARMLRRLHPALPITIAGRNLQAAETLALEIGAASAVSVDLGRTDLGLPAGREYSAVVTALRDLSLNSMRYAQGMKIPYLALSDAPFEIGPLAARFMHDPHSAVMLLGHGIGGVPALAALHFAKGFESVDRIDIGLIFDPQDPFGPASAVDMAHIAEDGPPSLILERGAWRWGDSPASDDRPITGPGGVRHEGQAVGLLDVLSLASVMPQGSIRVDAAQGPTQSSRAGGKPSHEVVIEIEGKTLDGSHGRHRYALIDGDGYAALSARGIAVAVETMLGLVGGPPPPAGLYFPESVMDTDHFMDRLRSFGVSIGQEVGPDA